MDEETEEFLDRALGLQRMWNMLGLSLLVFFLSGLLEFKELDFIKLDWKSFIDTYNSDVTFSLLNLSVFFVAKAIEKIEKKGES